MALAEVARLEQENASLRTIAQIAMSELTAAQLARVRARLEPLDAGEGADGPAR